MEDWIRNWRDAVRNRLILIKCILRNTKGLTTGFLSQFSNKQLKNYINRLEIVDHEGL